MEGTHRPTTLQHTTALEVTNLRRLLTRLCCALAVFWSLSPWAEAQGCAMCRTSAAAAAQVASAAQALNVGIMVLLVPPLTLMSTILYITFREDSEDR